MCRGVINRFSVILFQMARFNPRIYLLSALVLLVGTAKWTHAEEDDSDDGVTVEVSFYVHLHYVGTIHASLFHIELLASVIFVQCKRPDMF